MGAVSAAHLGGKGRAEKGCVKPKSEGKNGGAGLLEGNIPGALPEPGSWPGAARYPGMNLTIRRV